MSDEDDNFVNDILEHRDYNPTKAHEYYLRTRKLKGRRKKVSEDDVPATSRGGAKIVDYNSANGGRATYTDGSTYDGAGWNSDAKNRKRTLTKGQRVKNVEKSLEKARSNANRIKDPAFKKSYLARIDNISRKLKRVSRPTGVTE